MGNCTFDQDGVLETEEKGQVGNLPHDLPHDVPRVSEFAREKLGFAADERQKEVLDSTAKRGILNCSRQWGKSTVAAVKAVHCAWSEAGGLVLVASPSERQSGEFVRKAAEFVRRLGIRARGDGDNALSLLLPNGSRIVGLPGTEATVRGFSAVSLLLVDEAARVEDELYQAVRPMLAVSDGTLWLMSTPNGQRGFFWEAWAHGGPEWERVRVPAEECPRIKREFLEEERRVLDARRYGQEYGCEFGDAEDAVFDRELIERAITDEFEPLRFA